MAIALVRRGSTERPLVLDFGSEDDLAAVRRALGLGHFAFGELTWPTQVKTTTLQGSPLLALAWLAIAGSSAFGLTVLAFTLALVVLPVDAGRAPRGLPAGPARAARDPHPGGRAPVEPSAVDPARPLRRRARRERRRRRAFT